MLGLFSAFLIVLSPCRAIEYFTEDFWAAEEFDLDGLSITFTPDGSDSGYSAKAFPITALPTDPGTWTPVFGDDGYQEVAATYGSVVLYSNSYTSVFVGSNGYITFDAGDSSYAGSFGTHFNQPRISALSTDLLPTTGSVKVKRMLDRLVVTFINVPEFGTSNSNTFQIEMFFDGVIRMSWLGIEASNVLVGLSRGGGTPAGFIESDLSEFEWDSDGDGMPNTWEMLYFGGNTNGNPVVDSDGDGFSNLKEYIADTHPLDPLSYFHATQKAVQKEGGGVDLIIGWDAAEGREYSVREESNLLMGDFSNVLQSGINYPVNAYTTAVDQAQAARFYKVDVKLAE